jgi:TPP-dependent 2-oxoacid decarboxylase
MPKTVMQYVLGRLKDIGIDDVFAVAGDFAFPVHDAIVQDPDINYIGCCNELNAGYAADGYARIHGVGAVSTTYGVGELSAISAVGGSYAENVPVFHLVGMPATAAQHKRELVHHTLGNGEFDFFVKMARPVTCARAIASPQNAVYETERLIAEMLYHRRPVYLSVPTDVADREVLGAAQRLDPPRSNTDSVSAATEAIVSALDSAGTACVLPGWQAKRAGLQPQLQAFIDASGLSFATMFGDKSVLEEQQLTAQEISQLGRRGLKPVVFVLNNSGYLIERLLGKDPNIAYNDLAPWRYSELPHALGCDGWFTARVTTCGELDGALKEASQSSSGSYIEIITDKYAAPPLPEKMHESIATLYA